MSASIRFLAVAVLAWAGVRAATLGVLPGAEVWRSAHAETPPPPIIPTYFPPPEPVAQAAGVPAYPFPYPAAYAQYGPPRYIGIPIHYYPAGAPADLALQPRRAGYSPPVLERVPEFYAPVTPIDEWEIADYASGPLPDRRRSIAIPAGNPIIPQKHLDRLHLSAWALLRGHNGSGSLATGGTLGGSQAGARLTYALDPRLALSLRSSSPVGGARGGEVAAGVRVTPFPSLPVAITAERRQAIGRYGGRSAFALFLEGGLYQSPLPWDFRLDAYAQAGVVGLNSRDLFADGGLSVLRPVYGPVSVGMGLWGGAQPNLYRVDAGPRLSVRVRRNMRVDLDWRQRVAGQAEPGSGPALTLAADF